MISERKEDSKAGMTPYLGLNESSLKNWCNRAVRKLQYSGAIGIAKPLHYSLRIFGLMIVLPTDDH